MPPRPSDRRAAEGRDFGWRIGAEDPAALRIYREGARLAWPVRLSGSAAQWRRRIAKPFIPHAREQDDRCKLVRNSAAHAALLLVLARNTITCPWRRFLLARRRKIIRDARRRRGQHCEGPVHRGPRAVALRFVLRQAVEQALLQQPGFSKPDGASPGLETNCLRRSVQHFRDGLHAKFGSRHPLQLFDFFVSPVPASLQSHDRDPTSIPGRHPRGLIAG